MELDWWVQNLDLNNGRCILSTAPTDSNPIQCFQVRLGSSVPREISWGALATRGKKGAYQPSWIESSSYGCIDFRRETKTRVNSLTDGQSGCITVHKKNREYSESKNEPGEQRIVGISNREWDHNYFRISPRETQYSSGQGISKKGQQQMEIKSQDVSETVLCKGSFRNRSVCQQNDNSARSVLLLRNRPLESGNRCISTKLEESKGICISPLFPSGSSSEKSPERASKPFSNCASMAVTSLVSTPVADVHKKSDFVAKVAKLGKTVKKSSWEKSLIVQNNSLQLVAWTVSGESCLQMEYRKNLPSLSLRLGEREQSLITNWPGERFVAGVLGKRLIPLDVL